MIHAIEHSKWLIFFPRKIEAVTLGGTIRFRNEVYHPLRWHEVTHVPRYKKQGLWNVLWRFFVLEYAGLIEQAARLKDIFALGNRR